MDQQVGYREHGILGVRANGVLLDLAILHVEDFHQERGSCEQVLLNAAIIMCF